MPHALDRPLTRRPGRRHPGGRPKRPAALRILAGTVLILSLGVAAGSAPAQTASKPAPAQAQAPAGQKPGAAPAQDADDPVEAHLAELKKEINITAAQQPKFDEFAKILKQNAATMDAAMQKVQQSAQQTAVEG